jgi:hypothetical protein
MAGDRLVSKLVGRVTDVGAGTPLATPPRASVMRHLKIRPDMHLALALLPARSPNIVKPQADCQSAYSRKHGAAQRIELIRRLSSAISFVREPCR